jgi:hypothetical protein
MRQCPSFDVHAIITSEDAPQLEHSLHKAFAARRVNGVNHRKGSISASPSTTFATPFRSSTVS